MGRGFIVGCILVVATGCVDRSAGADADTGEAICVPLEKKSDGCNGCECRYDDWNCEQAACAVGLGEASFEGPRCYPICPEAVDPDVIRETLECTVWWTTEGGSLNVLPICGDVADECVRVRSDRLGLSASTDDDVAAQCLVNGSGLDLELVGLDDVPGPIWASCTIRWATDADACRSE